MEADCPSAFSQAALSARLWSCRRMTVCFVNEANIAKINCVRPFSALYTVLCKSLSVQSLLIFLNQAQWTFNLSSWYIPSMCLLFARNVVHDQGWLCPTSVLWRRTSFMKRSNISESIASFTYKLCRACIAFAIASLHVWLCAHHKSLVHDSDLNSVFTARKMSFWQDKMVEKGSSCTEESFTWYHSHCRHRQI